MNNSCSADPGPGKEEHSRKQCDKSPDTDFQSRKRGDTKSQQVQRPYCSA